MGRTSIGSRRFGLRITPDDVRDCFAFLRRAAELVRKGLPGAAGGPIAPPRRPGRPGGAHRHRR